MNNTNSQHAAHLPYLRLEFIIEPAGNLPHAAAAAEEGSSIYWGPQLRRLLGKELAAISCPLPPPVCRRAQGSGVSPPLECAMKERCAFGVLFAKSLATQVAGGVNALSPFSIYAPATSSTGTLECVEITLYASAWPFYMAMAQALGRVLSAGIGRERRSYALYRVNRVSADNTREVLCGERLSDIPRSIQPDDLTAVLRTTADNIAPVSLELAGPTRLLQNKKLLKGDAPIPFSSIIDSILARLRDHYGTLSQSYLPGDVTANLKQQLDQITVQNSTLQWIEIPDHGLAHRTTRRLGGKIGHLTFTPSASHFLPLLKAGEILHIGKNPASGCGRIRVVTPKM